MFRLACLINALLVLPFAVACLIAPTFVFAQFGIPVEGLAAGVARGYAATTLGWGISAALLSANTDPAAQRAFLWGSLAFNLAEVAIQLPLYLAGTVSPMILVTIAGHGLAAAATLLAFRRIS
jgi:hypothetical protein